MNVRWPIEIAGTGLATPATVVTNKDFEKRLETSDDWIAQRTGIRQRYLAQPGETTVSMATAAARQALAEAGLKPTDLDLIINATITPDHTLPSAACEMQAALGCGWIPAYDLVAACSGFVYALITAANSIQCGMSRNVLVSGAETMSRIIDMEDRTTAVLFGDAAACAVIRPSTDPQRGIIHARMAADGVRGELIWIPAGGVAEPATQRTVNERLHYVRMRGREVYKFAVTQMQDLIDQTLREAGVAASDVTLMIPHQSNLRIIESACEKLGFGKDRVVINIDRYGNTSAASVPIALHESRANGRIKPGDLVLLVAFGAGLTWASALMRV